MTFLENQYGIFQMSIAKLTFTDVTAFKSTNKNAGYRYYAAINILTCDNRLLIVI